MTMKALLNLYLGLFFLAGLQACYYDNKEDLYQHAPPQDCNFQAVSYSTDIIAIMDGHCMSCHNPNDQFGNVNLEGYNNVKNYANNGSLYGSVAHQNGFSIMPPSGQKIPQCSIDKIKTWVDSGAPDN